MTDMAVAGLIKCYFYTSYTDINECDNNPCSQECANIYGSYQCYCRQGYQLAEDGHSCKGMFWPFHWDYYCTFLLESNFVVLTCLYILLFPQILMNVHRVQVFCALSAAWMCLEAISVLVPIKDIPWQQMEGLVEVRRRWKCFRFYLLSHQVKQSYRTVRCYYDCNKNHS